MVRTTRRLGIACLTAALATVSVGSSQGGLIPWAYDIVFGPNYSMYGGYGYGGYGVPYSVGYSPCGPAGCSVSSSCSPCSTGTCQPRTSYCSPCEMASTKTCEPKTDWDSKKPTLAAPKKSAEVKTNIRNNIDPMGDDSINDLPPRRSGRPSYPIDDEQDLKKVVTEPEPTKVEPRNTPANEDVGTPGFIKTLPNEPNFSAPKPGASSESGKSPAPTFGIEPEGQAARRPLNLDHKSTWSLTSRLPQRATQETQPSRFNDARLARRPVDPKADVRAVPTATVVKK